MRAASPMDALLDPELIANTILFVVVIGLMYVIQQWVDKHHPHR